MEIRTIGREEIPACAALIRAAFATVAEEFGLTRESCPGFTAFLPDEKLYAAYDAGVRMYGLYEKWALAGFVALEDTGEGVWYLEKLAVLPACRHRGYGEALLDFARNAVRQSGGKAISIGVMQENTRLTDWYARYGFRPTITKKYDHLPFTVGYMELKL